MKEGDLSDDSCVCFPASLRKTLKFGLFKIWGKHTAVTGWGMNTHTFAHLPWSLDVLLKPAPGEAVQCVYVCVSVIFLSRAVPRVLITLPSLVILLTSLH